MKSSLENLPYKVSKETSESRLPTALSSSATTSRNTTYHSSSFDHEQAIKLIRKQSLEQAMKKESTIQNKLNQVTAVQGEEAFDENIEELVQQLHNRVLQRTMKEAQLRILTQGKAGQKS